SFLTARRDVTYDVPGEAPAPTIEPTAGRSRVPPLARSVLIVDDEPGIRELIVEYVKSSGAEAWEASNGLEALWVVKHQRPQLVLLDLTMPRLDGYETIRHIQKFDPSIRVVVITGDATETTRQRVAALGVEVLLKPIDLQALDALFGD